MKLLLDSHVIVWIAKGHPALTREDRRFLGDASHEFFVSIASLWELSIKMNGGKLRLQTSLRAIVEDAGYTVLGMDIDDAELAAALPPHHRDPFDRMLIAQALNKKLVLVTADKLIHYYNVPLMKL
jgi:PIN domain nuclease of toxin-antitoxin system